MKSYFTVVIRMLLLYTGSGCLPLVICCHQLVNAFTYYKRTTRFIFEKAVSTVYRSRAWPPVTKIVHWEAALILPSAIQSLLVMNFKAQNCKTKTNTNSKP